MLDLNDRRIVVVCQNFVQSKRSTNSLAFLAPLTTLPSQLERDTTLVRVRAFVLLLARAHFVTVCADKQTKCAFADDAANASSYSTTIHSQ